MFTSLFIQYVSSPYSQLHTVLTACLTDVLFWQSACDVQCVQSSCQYHSSGKGNSACCGNTQKMKFGFGEPSSIQFATLRYHPTPAAFLGRWNLNYTSQGCRPQSAQPGKAATALPTAPTQSAMSLENQSQHLCKNLENVATHSHTCTTTALQQHSPITIGLTSHSTNEMIVAGPPVVTLAKLVQEVSDLSWFAHAFFIFIHLLSLYSGLQPCISHRNLNTQATPHQPTLHPT